MSTPSTTLNITEGHDAASTPAAISDVLDPAVRGRPIHGCWRVQPKRGRIQHLNTAAVARRFEERQNDIIKCWVFQPRGAASNRNPPRSTAEERAQAKEWRRDKGKSSWKVRLLPDEVEWQECVRHNLLFAPNHKTALGQEGDLQHNHNTSHHMSRLAVRSQTQHCPR